MMGSQSFHWKLPGVLLLKNVEVTTGLELVLACGVFLVFAVILEGSKCLRHYLNRTEGQRSRRRRKLISLSALVHMLQTLLYLLELLIAYCLMLGVMTFNTTILLSVAIGSGLGFFLFKSALPKYHYTVERPDTDDKDDKDDSCLLKAQLIKVEGKDTNDNTKIGDLHNDKNDFQSDAKTQDDEEDVKMDHLEMSQFIASC